MRKFLQKSSPGPMTFQHCIEYSKVRLYVAGVSAANNMFNTQCVHISYTLQVTKHFYNLLPVNSKALVRAGETR